MTKEEIVNYFQELYKSDNATCAETCPFAKECFTMADYQALCSVIIGQDE